MKTKKYRFNYKGLVSRAFSYINDAVLKGKRLGQIKEELRDLVNSYAGLNKDERYDIYWSCLKVCRAARRSKTLQKYIAMTKSFDEIMSAARRTKGTYELRVRRRATREALDDKETIFFLCSTHPNCAEGHKQFQGKILVDRFWRTKVKGFDYYKVWSYIKNHNVMTVQESMQEPYWLITRKYCRHILIPMSTNAVLTTSQKKLSKTYGQTYELGYDRDEYYKVRKRVYAKLNRETPCSEYKNKSRD